VYLNRHYTRRRRQQSDENINRISTLIQTESETNTAVRERVENNENIHSRKTLFIIYIYIIFTVAGVVLFCRKYIYEKL
jgi:hypothetical protein